MTVREPQMVRDQNKFENHCSIWTLPFNQAPFKSLINFSAFSQWEVGRASHLVYKFDKKIARCNNSLIKILNLFEFPHELAA